MFTVTFCIIAIKLACIDGGTVINKSPDILLAPVINDEPIIGILSQEMSSQSHSQYGDQYHSYIAASYVKFVEGGGARVVPVWIGKNRSYYEDIMSKLNGILFPGGALSFTDPKGYSEAGQYIYQIASELNDRGDYFPLWGTCLGFEFLTYVSANQTEIRANCNSYSQSVPLTFKTGFKASRMFGTAPDTVIKILQNEAVTANFHSFCVTEKNLTDYHIDSMWRVMSVNTDWNGFEFISTIEHRQYPFYAVQFHPEKNLYEWIHGRNISHTSSAMTASRYFANFFVDETRKNGHRFVDDSEANRYLIYNFPVVFSGRNGSAFEQTYLFNEDDDYKVERLGI